jgi:RNA polymerase sigma factor (sigma-70 family)
MPDDATTRLLVAGAATGDQHAWDGLVDAFAGLVWSVIRSHGFYGAEGADISQTVWLRMVEHLDRLREPERAGAWLATTARHECLRTLRRQGRTVLVEEPPEPAATGASIDSALVAADDRNALHAALARAPARCQELLRLLLCDPPLSYDDVSAILAMPKGSIGPTRQRCLGHLRNILSGTGIRDAGPDSVPVMEDTP